MISHILQQGIRHTEEDPAGVTPGGVLAYGSAWENAREQGGNGANDQATIAVGRSHFPRPGDADHANGVAFDITADTIYDIASLTKPIATAAVLMKLDIDLDAPVRPLVPELTARGGDRITFAHLLGHASGLPAHRLFYERLWAGQMADGLSNDSADDSAGGLAGAPGRREALLRMAGATELDHAPGTAAVYSDLGYIVLGFAIERLTGKRLDQAVAELVTGPLGMTSTFFVDLDAGVHADPRRARIAPTERCARRGLVRGEVHDENAHAGGGIHGHAGLFATAGDVARFGRALVRAAAGEPTGGFDPAVVRRFFATSAAPGTTRRLGWDRPAAEPGISHAGDAWPRDGIGHLGFTGCSLWLAPRQGYYAVLLTNRVHPGRARTGIGDFRRAVMDAVVDTLTTAADRA